MYESHFGITRSPFQLTPDPWFYFDSEGHRHALAALRRGCGRGQAFAVVSGEIGSGKSMLVRSRLDEFDGRVVVGYIANTQLSGDELRRAVAAAFGIALTEQTAAECEREIAGLLESLQGDGRRAVLIIDEAQHLDPAALVALEALVPCPPQALPPLEVWLVGQPELRQVLAAPELASLRRRLGVSCHLGPLEAAETRAYVEHRLSKVGWTGRPHFEPEAFEAIHRCSGGLPRQINRLCNRLLLDCFLSSVTVIDAPEVVRAARDIQLELEGREGLPRPEIAAVEALSESIGASARTALVPSSSAQGSCQPPHKGRLLCVVGGQADHVKAAALMNALGQGPQRLPCTLVRVYRNDALRLHRTLFDDLSSDGACVELDITANAQAVQIAQVADRFEQFVKWSGPCGVVVFDGSELALACTVVASRHGVPVANVGAGVRLLRRTRTGDLTRTLTDRLAQLLYTCDETAGDNLRVDGIPAHRVHRVGNIVSDAVANGLRKHTLMTGACPSDAAAAVLSDRRGYGVVVLNQPGNVERRERLRDLVQVLRQAQRDLPLVWTMARRTEQRLKDFGLSGVVASERIACIGLQSHPAFLRLLSGATCVLSDSEAVSDEALVLGVPCLGLFDPADRHCGAGPAATIAVGTDPRLVTRALWSILYGGSDKAFMPSDWDGGVAARIAQHLRSWGVACADRTAAHAMQA